MKACILQRISEADLGGDQNADTADSFAWALLSLTEGEGFSNVGAGLSKSTVSYPAKQCPHVRAVS